MKRLLPIVALLGVVAGLAGTSAAYAGGSGTSGSKGYTCSNQGGGPNHKVVCGGVLSGNDVTIDINDVNVLSGDQLTVLEGSLDNLNIANLDQVTQITDIKDTIVSVYENDFDIPLSLSEIGVCVGLICL